MATAFQASAFQAAPAFQIDAVVVDDGVVIGTGTGSGAPEAKKRRDLVARIGREDGPRKLPFISRREPEAQPELDLEPQVVAKAPVKTDRVLTQDELARLTDALLAETADQARLQRLRELEARLKQDEDDAVAVLMMLGG